MYSAVHLDFESRSAADLKKTGVHKYCADLSTNAWGFRYKFDGDDAIYEWRHGYPDPVALLHHIANGGVFKAHNLGFERTMWNVVMRRQFPHWPELKLDQCDCTMARAASISHPQSLDKLGDALRLPLRKDLEGSKVMMKMAKPRRFNPDGTITWWDDPDDLNRNMMYCGRDVEVECLVDETVPNLPDRERQVWMFDQTINDRGVHIDVPFVTKMAATVEYAKKQNDRVMRELTGRQVSKCSKDRDIIAWLNSRGIECDSLAKGEVEDVIFLASAYLDTVAHDVIKLRQAAWKTSTAKFKAMLECVMADMRIRGLLNYYGANTGRWAGRLVQPQNFPRVDSENEFLQLKIALLHELAATLSPSDIYHYIADLYGPLEVMDLISKALRSAVCAPEGKKLVGGDFSNIEGRVNAWLAGETWKLNAFKEYDDGTGPDLYKLAYATSFGVPVESVGKGAKRQMGKVQELALGYQGGIGAFLQMGATYGLNPYSLAGPVQEATPTAQWDATAARYYQKGAQHHDLKVLEWTALQVLVDNWRSANPAIVQSWWNYQDAAIEAVGSPGNIVYPKHTQLIHYYSDGRTLWCGLPSGRYLAYSMPELVEEFVEYTDKATGEVKHRLKRKVTFWGTDSKTRQWVKRTLYGGLQCENIVQAVARDIMVDAMFAVEDRGYEVILTVHDEVVAEVDDDPIYNDKDFENVMSVTAPVYAGLPISVGAWEDKRYVK